MSLNQTQQIFAAINKANQILITFKQAHNQDAIASTLALANILLKQNKKVDLICSDFIMPNNLKFLKNNEQIQPTLSALKRLVISLDTTNNKVANFSYDTKDNNLNIYITPAIGAIDPKNIKIKSSNYKYDLIICLDTDDLNSLGTIFQANTEFFYNVPIINIDHSPANENYGQINLVDINATSTAEILLRLITDYDKNLIDVQTATALLTGMISKTKSFKTQQVTPKTLHLASELISYGADRELIIKNLYYTKSIETLKLWGKVLARLNHEEQYNLVWSYISIKDLDQLPSNSAVYEELIEELIINAPQAQIILLFFQTAIDKIDGLIHTTKNHDSLYLSKDFNPTGTKNLARFSLNHSDLSTAGTHVINKIKEKITI